MRTMEDVQAWAVKEKLGEDVAGAFVRSGVEGAALLNINEKDVSEQFGISDPKLTKKLLAFRCKSCGSNTKARQIRTVLPP